LAEKKGWRVRLNSAFFDGRDEISLSIPAGFATPAEFACFSVAAIKALTSATSYRSSVIFAPAPIGRRRTSNTPSSWSRTLHPPIAKLFQPSPSANAEFFFATLALPQR
jgi:hypothetical protein